MNSIYVIKYKNEYVMAGGYWCTTDLQKIKYFASYKEAKEYVKYHQSYVAIRDGKIVGYTNILNKIKSFFNY